MSAEQFLMNGLPRRLVRTVVDLSDGNPQLLGVVDQAAIAAASSYPFDEASVQASTDSNHRDPLRG